MNDAAIQEPIPQIGVPTLVDTPNTGDWTEIPAEPIKSVQESAAERRQEINQNRMVRLVQQRPMIQLEVLKLRLDCVTDFVVDPRIRPMLEELYEQNVSDFLDFAEGRQAREMLTTGVRP